MDTMQKVELPARWRAAFKTRLVTVDPFQDKGV